MLMAGPLAKDPPITAGILALLIGAACALAGAVVAGMGQIRVLRAASAPEARPMEAVETILGRTAATFAYLPRFALAGCVALLAAYTIWLPSGFWGAVVGTFVVIQAAAILFVVRSRLLSSARLHRAH